MTDINTGGGASVQGNANAGNDFVGRNKLIAEFIYQFHSIVFEGVAKPSRYQEEQFEAYARVWKSLQLLRICADDLWDRVTVIRLSEFARQLRETTMEVRQNQIFFEDEDFHNLMSVLRDFQRFEIGKVDLLRYYSINPSKYGEDRFELEAGYVTVRQASHFVPRNPEISIEAAADLIGHQIHENHVQKERYEEVLSEISKSFQVRLQKL